MVKPRFANLACNLFSSAGSQSNLWLTKEVKPLPVSQAAKGCWGLCHHPCFCNHQKNKLTPINDKKAKTLRAPVKPERANSEEMLPRILAGRVGHEGLPSQAAEYRLSGCKAGSVGPSPELSDSQPPPRTGSRWEAKRRTRKKDNKKKALGESKMATAAAKSNQANAVTLPALS